MPRFYGFLYIFLGIAIIAYVFTNFDYTLQLVYSAVLGGMSIAFGVILFLTRPKTAL